MCPAGKGVALMQEQRGLYDPRADRDECGIGFVANVKGEKSHDIIVKGIQILVNLQHRGASGSARVRRVSQATPPSSLAAEIPSETAKISAESAKARRALRQSTSKITPPLYNRKSVLEFKIVAVLGSLLCRQPRLVWRAKRARTAKPALNLAFRETKPHRNARSGEADV